MVDWREDSFSSVFIQSGSSSSKAAAAVLLDYQNRFRNNDNVTFVHCTKAVEGEHFRGQNADRKGEKEGLEVTRWKKGGACS